MSVFNDAEHLAPTIDSILAQTERDLELVIVDDGSTDATSQILADFADRDSRVRVIAHENAGITRALINGCAAARAPLIARHDAGDLSHPQRIEKQAELFDRHPELTFASSWVDFAGPELEHLYTLRGNGVTTTPSRVIGMTKERPVLDGPSHHGSVMFRHNAYELVGGYRREFYYSQDWDLWFRLAENGLFARVPQILYTARILPTGISSAAREQQSRLGHIALAALAARQRGESDAQLVAEAATIRPVRRAMTRRRAAAAAYFIGEALRRNRDRRARHYLRRSIAAWPFSIRAWIRLIQSWLL
jgi:glycosyltransferase involved in cell wall biosynthesis